MSISDGRLLVILARKTVESYFKTKTFDLKETEFSQKSGVFVSIHTHPDNELRGCIGYINNTYPLGEAVQKAAFSAAFEDTRFSPLTEKELNNVVFEVSVLTKPELINVNEPKEYLEKIHIGRDGLIVDHGILHKGLLLPQVPTQFKPEWDVETFLEQTCLKAGILPDMWMDSQTRIYKFQCKIFAEKKPNGEIISKKH